jgi:hypothetical protein
MSTMPDNLIQAPFGVQDAHGVLIPDSLRPGISTRIECGPRGAQWLHDVIVSDTEWVFESLKLARLEMLEVSGANWGPTYRGRTESNWTPPVRFVRRDPRCDR